VQLIGDAREDPARDQLPAPVGHAVAVLVVQSPEARRGRREDGPIVPEDPLGI
jgi:hypothetical protein